MPLYKGQDLIAGEEGSGLLGGSCEVKYYDKQINSENLEMFNQAWKYRSIKTTLFYTTNILTAMAIIDSNTTATGNQYKLIFTPSDLTSKVAGNSKNEITINSYVVTLTISNDGQTVTKITNGTQSDGSGNYYLSTEQDYSTPFVPTKDGHPATKKYVDDSCQHVIDNIPLGGHEIINSSGEQLTRRSNLQFIGFDLTDDVNNDTTIVDLTGTLDDLSELTTQVNTNTGNILQNSKDIQANKEAIGTNKNDITSLKSRMSTVETKASTNASDISALKTKTDTTNTNLTNLTKRVSTNETEIDNLQIGISDINSDITNLSSQIDTNAKNITTNKNDITALKTKTDATNAEVANNTSRIDEILEGTAEIPSVGNASNADNADKLGGQLPAYYAKASDLNKYLPLTGGTVTGKTVITGSAASASFWVRGITGCSTDGATADALYLNYNNSQPVYINGSNLVYHSGNIPKASTTVQGIVQLNNTRTSTSTTQAATASALKSAYDTINSALTTHKNDTNVHLTDEDRIILTKANKFKGYYETETALKNANPTGEAGDYAIINTTDTVWIWDEDKEGGAGWKDGAGKGSVVSVNNMTGEVVLTKSNIGLGNVDNTSDKNKPISTAQQTALDKKVDLAGDTMTGTLSSQIIQPKTNNTYTLGTSSLKWSNVYATTFTGALSGNASTATKLQTARTINGVSFDGSANITVADNTKLPLTGGTLTTSIYSGLTIKRSDSNGSSIHYSNSTGTLGKIGFNGSGDLIIGDSTDGTANFLKIANSNHQATFYGNVAPSANNTYSLGTSSLKWSNVYATTFTGALSGNASTATKLSSARTIALSGDVTGSASFDGSKNITINTTAESQRKTALIGNDTSSAAGWYKVMEQTMSGYMNSMFTFTVSGSGSNYFGILVLNMRADNTKVTCKRLQWLSRIGFDPNHFVVVVDGMKWTLYHYYTINQYYRTMFEIIGEQGTSSANAPAYTFQNNTVKEAATPEATVKSTDGSTVLSATKLTTARTINGTSFDGNANITTTNWGTARNIGIVNSDGTGTAVTTSVNGSANVNLKLPATIKASLNGNASTATTATNAIKLQTSRTIDGVSFNGSANIIHYGTCSTAAATTAKTVSCTGFTLVTGAWIAVKFTVTNTGAVGSLTLNVNGTGAKGIKYRNANLGSAGYLAANRVYMFVYDGTYYQLVGDINIDNNTYDRVKYGVNIKAGSAIVASNIIVGNNGTYSHLKTGNAFDISYPILYATSAINASATGNNNYISIPFTVTTTQSMTLTAYKPVYIKGKLTGTSFDPVSTTPLTQTIPTSEDGYHYMCLGTAYSTTAIWLEPAHQIYAYINGKFSPVASGSGGSSDAVTSKDKSVVNLVAMTESEFNSEMSSLPDKTAVVITDGGCVTTQATSLTCNLPLDL